MARAMRFYREQLKASPKAIDYFKGRGVSGEIAARFGLGYAPDAWQGLEQVFPDYSDPPWSNAAWSSSMTKAVATTVSATG
jgi:DNA primase